MKNRSLIFFLFLFCVSITTTYSQKAVVKSNAAPATAGKVDSTKNPIRRETLDGVFEQSGIIGKDLSDALLGKATPGIKNIVIYLRSHPGDPEVVTFAVSEARKTFGSRSQNVEDVLVCYLLGQAIKETMRNDPKTARMMFTMFDHVDQRTNQLYNILAIVLKNAKDLGADIVRNIN